MRTLLRLAWLYFLVAALPAAAAWQQLPPLRKAVESFVASRAGALPGKANITVGTIDDRLRLPRCDNLEAFLPPGARLWGNSTVGLRCLAPSPWSIYVQVNVQVMAPVVVSSRPLAQGRTLTRGDLALQDKDITRLPAGILSDPAQALGKTISSSIPANYPLRPDMLRAREVVKRGQIVKVTTRGPGFRVSGEGKALANAGAGETVSVRTPSGQVVSGIARPDGTVEVTY